MRAQPAPQAEPQTPERERETVGQA
jgi:hypothetical protein